MEILDKNKKMKIALLKLKKSIILQNYGEFSIVRKCSGHGCEAELLVDKNDIILDPFITYQLGINGKLDFSCPMTDYNFYFKCPICGSINWINRKKIPVKLRRILIAIEKSSMEGKKKILDLDKKYRWY